MELNNFQVGCSGFLPSSVIGFMHLEDIIMAFMLGMVGSAGAFVFKWVVSKLSRKQNHHRTNLNGENNSLI